MTKIKSDSLQYYKQFLLLESEEAKKEKRLEFINKYSYAIPNQEAIKSIAKYSPLIEVGAGHGYWSFLLDQAGANIIAFDDYSWFGKTVLTGENFYTDVEKASHKILKNYPERSLLLCWPPPFNDMAYKCVKTFKGKYFIYIGEDYKGCTANEKFHEYVYENFDTIEQIEIPTWPNFYDRLFIYKRK